MPIINILTHMGIIDTVIIRFSGLITVTEIMAAIEADIPVMVGIMAITVFMGALAVIVAEVILAATIDKT
ncbi:MAG: hypothetical protein PHY54_07605 [Methylococcales bacterium]|nr:hypothetical protein [Methylococcales bacterium]